MIVHVDVSDVKFYGTPRFNFLAYVSVVIGGLMALRDMRLIQRKDGRLLLVMPQQERNTGKVETYCPITKGARTMMEHAVFSAWESRGRRV